MRKENGCYRNNLLSPNITTHVCQRSLPRSSVLKGEKGSLETSKAAHTPDTEALTSWTTLHRSSSTTAEDLGLLRIDRMWGAWVAQLVKRLPSAQVMVPGSWDRAPHRAPCSAGSLLLPPPLPATLPTCALSLSLCQINK